MELSELLRKLADILDQTGQTGAQPAAVQPEAEPAAEPECHSEVEPQPVQVDNEDGTEAPTMVSPLQQEHELLKKSQGVDNHVDEFAGDENELDLTVGFEQETGVEEGEFRWGEPEKEEYADMQGAPDDDDDEDLDEMKRLAGVGEDNSPHDHAGDLKPVSINPRAVAATEANHGEVDPRLKNTQRIDK